MEIRTPPQCGSNHVVKAVGMADTIVDNKETEPSSDSLPITEFHCTEINQCFAHVDVERPKNKAVNKKINATREESGRTTHGL